MSSQDAPWRDESILREKYSDQRSIYRVADELGCSDETVRRWMHKHGIEFNPRPQLPSQRTDFAGYERVQVHSGDVIFIHQLLAIAKGYDPHDVFADETHVHHRNGLSWGNWPANIELKDAGEHISDHAQSREYERDSAGRFVCHS